jgi:tetratricopeptide (TPR) repeat protein
VQTVVAYLKAGNGPAAAAAAERAFAAEPDAGTANAIAWFYFREKRELETGISIARRGLELAPKNAGLRDTLAELLAAIGEHKAAATESARAQTDQPTDPYYAKQATRFAAAAAAAP